MIISGVALLAICTLCGALAGDLLGALIGVRSNVGGVGIAMLLLIAARIMLARRGLLTAPLRLGVELWGALYIPIVVAMAAQQNVLVAVRSGPMAIGIAVLTVTLCFVAVSMMTRFGQVADDNLPEEIGDLLPIASPDQELPR